MSIRPSNDAYVDLCLEPFDFQVALGQGRPRLEQQGLECIDVVRKVAGIRHATQFTQVLRGLQHRQWLSGATWLPPVDAFEQHRQLGMGQMDLAAIGLWPDEAAALEPFCKQP
jgi:hypothetical protein